MGTDIKSILAFEVPLVVVLGERSQSIHDIRNWVPGSIIELGKEADEDLEIRINNRAVGSGSAVKIGENFGIQVHYVGDPLHRIEAMGPEASVDAPLGDEVDAESVEDIEKALSDAQG